MAGSPKKRQRREAAEARAQGLAPTVFSDGVGDAAATVEDVLSRPLKRIPYSVELAEQICTLIALRVPLARICAQEGFPCETTVFKWRRENEAFDKMIAAARIHRAEARADRIDEISAKVELGLLDPIAGRVLFDTERWLAGRENPARYSEQAQTQKIELTGRDGAPLDDGAKMKEVARFFALAVSQASKDATAIDVPFESIAAPTR